MNTRTKSPPQFPQDSQSDCVHAERLATNLAASSESAARTTGPADTPPADGAIQAADERRRRYRRRTAIIWFIGPVGILLGSLLLTHGQGREVQIPGLGWSVPETCGLRLQFGLDCPGCGLTRSFIHLAHGEWYQAWQLHWMGSLLFLYTLAQIPLAIAYAWQPYTQAKWAQAWPAIVSLNERLLLGLLALLAVRWVYKLLTGDLL